MAAATPASVRHQIARRQPDPVYLIIGDDVTEMTRLAADMTALVEDELSVFNLDRMYATDKGVTAAPSSRRPHAAIMLTAASVGFLLAKLRSRATR